MPIPREEVASDPAATLSVASHSSHEETETRAHERTPLDDAILPRFAPASVAGELGRLGKYRIQKELGRGGMGAVYLAFDERLHRKVALKVMLPRAAANATAKERFLREARAAAQISSDHVVNIFEADEIDGIPFIALQFLQGYPLDEYLRKKGDLTLPQVVRIATDTALGLAKAHKLGIVHRDIKPGNLWLEAPTGRVKILDFGLAKPLVGAEGAELTGSGAVMGTPAYMAPEQGMGKPVDVRADLFSLGCVLYRLCTGNLPFDRPTIMAILTAIATEEPPPVRDMNPAVPEPLADLVRRLMSKNPDHRPASAQEVVKELDRISALLKSESKADLSSSQPRVIYVPVAVSILESNPFADIGAPTEIEQAEPVSKLEPPPKPPKKIPTRLFGSLFLGVIGVVAAAAIIIKITNKDGTVTEISVPDGSKIEVNGKTVIVSPKKEIPASLSDRKAAEYLLSIKGAVRVNGLDKEIKLDSGLPKEPFLLTGLNFDAVAVTDDQLSRFKDSTNLTYLNLKNCDRITDAGLAHFKDCELLSHLGLEGTNIGDAGLAHFKDCKQLTAIWLNRTKVKDSGLDHFKDRKNLTTLVVVDTAISATKFEELKRVLPRCRILSDHGMYEPPTDPERKAAEWVLSIRGAVRVNGINPEIRDAAELPKDTFQLTGVNLQGTRATDADLANLKDCKKLLILGLYGCEGVSNEGMVHFKNCKELQHLNLSTTQIGDAGLAHFKDCKDLILLDIGWTKLTDAGLANFKDCKKLTGLSLGGLKITDPALANFAGCQNLGVLSLSGSVKITDAGLAHFKNCSKLTSIDLASTKLSDDGLAHFKSCKSLNQLTLANTSVSDAGLAHFKDCAELWEVKVENTQVRDGALTQCKGYKLLTVLTLHGDKVSDTGLDQLKDCKSLKHLGLLKTALSPAKFEELKKALPKCTIESDHGTYEPK